ncbi:hypothetical protein KSX_37360 [Ktedonospora formicarum]|uniref:Uncharacterized protein n=1 Tax=Ktedonospora formicarum TaxID=2778364 RepID=A0A8J3I406_9CHLR|nr:hypothetical protein KSX_37360 [Ktedonospora formicarum]
MDITVIMAGMGHGHLPCACDATLLDPTAPLDLTVPLDITAPLDLMVLSDPKALWVLKD